MRYLGVAIAIAFAPSLPAQAVLDTPSGRYEVIGLERWTLGALQDSLAAHSESLTSHACAAVLRSKLGFPDASVVTYRGRSGRSQNYTEIMVVEPQDSARVQYLPLPTDSAPDRHEWQDGIALIRRNANLVGFLLNNLQVLYAAAPPDSLLRRSPDSELFRTFLANHTTAADLRLAGWTIRNDKNLNNISVAAFILGSPSGWPATSADLVAALRNPIQHASVTAASLLYYLVGTARVPVDWDAFVPTFHALLDGTNLFAYLAISALLEEAPPPPLVGRRLLEGGGHVPLSRLEASDSLVHASAYRLLKRLTAYDLPPDPATWRHALATR